MPDIFVAPKDKTEINSHPLASYPNATHLFSSFCENPTNVSFKDQDDDEKILLFLRRHFITNLPWILISLILLVIPFIILFVNSQFPNLNFINLPIRFIIAFTIFYYLIVATYIFINFITWYFNISLVTQKRVIDIDFSGLVYKNVAATKLSLVQDASYTQVGVIRSLFDYGDVLVQTAGTLDNFDFTAVPHPEKVIQIIEGLIGRSFHAI